MSLTCTMEMDDNHIETDNRKEIRSPTELLNNPECSETVPPPTESSNKRKSPELKIPFSAEALNNSEKVPSLAKASYSEESSKLTIPSSAEALNSPECSEKNPSLGEASNKGDSSELEIPTAAEELNNPKCSEKLPSPAEASNKGESSELEIPTAAEELNNPKSSDELPSPAEASNKGEPSELEILIAAEELNNPKSSEKIPSPVEASNKRESSELEIPIAAEELNNPKCTEKVPSSSEKSNIGESSELKIPTAAEELNNPECSEKVPSPSEDSNKEESSELKISFSAEALSEPSADGLSGPSAEELSGPKRDEKKMSSPVEASKQPDLSEKKTASPAGASNSGRKTPRSLKGKAKIVKNPPLDNGLKASKGASSSQVTGSKRKAKSRANNENSNKRVRGNNDGSNKREEDGKKLNPRNENQQNISKEEHREKNHQASKTPAKIEDLGKSQQKQRGKEIRHGSDKIVKSQKTSEKPDEKKEKLGGLIFMCSGKTKPDCFHYRIMGVSMGKKYLVLGIKPGLKLFLYDFDLKLLYGIYKASSSGRLKIEPNAFGGAFPAQVRFSVVKDCLPLPESVFKKAIKENYNTNKKFKTELTVRQVRKLTALFRPAQVHSSVLAPRSPPESKVQDRRGHERARESRPLSHRDAHTRDLYANGDDRSYLVLAHERDNHVAYRDVISARREEPSRDLYLTEKEYRTYGLWGERGNTTSHHVSPALEARNREYEREHLLRQPNHIRREAVPPSGPHYLNDRDYPAFSIGARHELPPATSSAAVDVYARDPYYHYYYGASSLDPYLATHRTEDISSGSYSVGGRREDYRIQTEHVQRREPDRVERSLYWRQAAEAAEAAEAADASRRYNQTDSYQAAKREVLPAPVSSRYAFAGPSYSYQ